MSLTITELDQKARDFLTLSGRMRDAGLDRDTLSVLAQLYIAHKPQYVGDIERSTNQKRMLIAACLLDLERRKLAVRSSDLQSEITRKGRALLEEVLA